MPIFLVLFPLAIRPDGIIIIKRERERERKKSIETNFEMSRFFTRLTVSTRPSRQLSSFRQIEINPRNPFPRHFFIYLLFILFVYFCCFC